MMVVEPMKLIRAWLDGELNEPAARDLGAWLRADRENIKVFVRETHFHRQLRDLLVGQQSEREAAPGYSLRELGPLADHHPSLPDCTGRTQRTARSPVLGFLSGLFHAGHETPVANALMWLVMAILSCGMVLTIFFCIVLVFRGVGVNVHVDATAPQVAGRNSDGESGTGRNSDGESGRWGDGETNGLSPSPHPPISPSPRPSVSESTVARLINAYDCRWSIGSHSPRVGDDLEPGRKLDLLSGFAEVMYQSGVRALLEGPATMEIDSQKSALLRVGKLTVRVEDPDARGFEVHAPGMKYTDLGTEFGVSVARDGTQEMIVFRGKVRAEAVETAHDRAHAISPSPHLPISPSSLVLSASQAIHVTASTNASGRNPAVTRVTANEKLFVRTSAGPEPFSLFGTGIGLDRGAADPHWEIVAVSTDGRFEPRPPKVILKRDNSYARDSRERGQWVSLAAENTEYPEYCRWTFRTTFDLTGYDPNSARIEGKFAVDNYIIDVRLNGQALPVADRGEYKGYHPIKIEKGFVAGVNTVEIMILNDTSGIPANPGSPMALCVDWKGTARKVPARY
jgi:hypothetical protein